MPSDRVRLQSLLHALPSGALPLHLACSRGGIADESVRDISVLRLWAENGRAHARIGVFFSERVGGCNCHDDPVDFPVHACFELRIDPRSGIADVALVED